MALQDLLSLKQISSVNDEIAQQQKIGLSEERVMAQIPVVRQYAAFWREYPDIFVDFMKGSNPENFNLFFYQRLFLRNAMRHRYMYATFPRAFSKSFLSVMILMIKCVLYPGAKLFVTTGGKEQATQITKEKVEEICRLIPGFNNEIDWRPGKTRASKEMVIYTFKNGSTLDIVAARNSNRGVRRHGGLMEECILIDGTDLNEIIIPTMNISRHLPGGETRDEEKLNKSQIYVTTAGWKNSFAYQKLIQLLIQQITEPEEAVVMGGTWRIPVMEHLLDKHFIRELQLDGTYNEASFAREYESEWGGDAENAFFSSEVFDKHRVLLLPEKEMSGRRARDTYYVLGVDVGRKGCATEIVVIKVTPQEKGSSKKSVVNILSYMEEHFEAQAINIKNLYYKYHARRIAIDANGLGIGLVDFLVKSQDNTDVAMAIDYPTLPPFGVMNDTDGSYKRFKTSDTEEDALFLIKAHTNENTEAYTYIQSQLSSGHIKFLIDEQTAKIKLLNTKVGQQMTPDQRTEYLRPFNLTTVLREQMLNLVQENEGFNIILKQATRAIPKDRFSALLYGLYYIKQEENKHVRQRSRDLSKLMLFN